MSPESKGWDQNLRFTQSFGLILALVSPLVIWIAWPMFRDLPFYSKVAGCVVLPFLAAIVIFVFGKVFHLAFIRKEISKIQVQALLVTMIFIVGVFFLSWKIYGGADAPFFVTGSTSFLAIMVYGLVSKCCDNSRG